MAVSGDLALTSLADILQLYAGRNETVAIRLESPLGIEYGGTLFLEGGEVVHAALAEFAGPLALKAALRMRKGRFTVERGVKAGRRTITEPLRKLLMDAHEEGAFDSALSSPDEEPAMANFKDIPPPPPPKKPTSLPPRAGPGSRPPLPPGDEEPEAPLARTEPPRLEPTLPPPPRSRRGLIAVIAAAAVIATVAILAVAVPKKEEAPAPAVIAVKAPPPAPPPELPPYAFGMVAPLTGPVKELGRQMRTGIEVAFAVANEAGGVAGRKLKLVALDDGYEPARTLSAMKELVEKHHVLGFIGNVGTPTAAVAVPYALEQKLLFFGAFTGAPLLRKEPPDRYVFNFRASYAEETAATVKYLVEVRRVKPEQIAVFAQKDSYGDAGFEGVAKTLRVGYQRDPQKILRVGYERNSIDVQVAVDEVMANRSTIRAVIMVATYKAAAKFIEKLREKGGDQIVTNVSFVGSTALAEELTALGPKFVSGVIVTQVVPLPDAGATSLMRYREQLAKYALGEKPDFVSLEGYVAASILVESLKHAGKDATSELIVDSLEQLRNLDLGFGAPFAFGLSQHQASHKVWGTVLDEKGRFQPIDLD